MALIADTFKSVVPENGGGVSEQMVRTIADAGTSVHTPEEAVQYLASLATVRI